MSSQHEHPAIPTPLPAATGSRPDRLAETPQERADAREDRLVEQDLDYSELGGEA
jgi:hypothetical protein